jgi:hypothetical protein
MWKADEDAALVRAVAKFGVGEWKLVASAVSTRDHVQCAQRWQKGLFPEEQRGGHVLPPWGAENWRSESMLHPEAHAHRSLQCNCPLRTCGDAFTGVDAFVDGYSQAFTGSIDSRTLSDAFVEARKLSVELENEHAGDLGIPWIASWPPETCCTEAICCRVLQAAYPGFENVSKRFPAFPWFCEEELVTVLPSELEPYALHLEIRTPPMNEPYDGQDLVTDLHRGGGLHELENVEEIRRKLKDEQEAWIAWMAWLRRHWVLMSVVGVKILLICYVAFLPSEAHTGTGAGEEGLADEGVWSTDDEDEEAVAYGREELRREEEMRCALSEHLVG